LSQRNSAGYRRFSYFEFPFEVYDRNQPEGLPQRRFPHSVWSIYRSPPGACQEGRGVPPSPVCASTPGRTESPTRSHPWTPVPASDPPAGSQSEPDPMCQRGIFRPQSRARWLVRFPGDPPLARCRNWPGGKWGLDTQRRARGRPGRGARAGASPNPPRPWSARSAPRRPVAPDGRLRGDSSDRSKCRCRACPTVSSTASVRARASRL